MKLWQLESTLCLTLLVLGLTSSAASYKILVPILTPSKSHYNQAKAICDILHERGHEVTFISGYVAKTLPYRSIFIPEILKDMDFDVDVDMAALTYWDKFSTVDETKYFVTMVYDNAFKSETFQKFLNDKNEKFDIIIMDYVINEVFFALSVKYDCPLIVLSPAPLTQWLARLTGNSVSPATVPNFFLDFTAEMTFKERLINTVMSIYQDYYIYFVYEGIQRSYYYEYFPEEAAKVTFEDLKKKISFVFSNTYPALGAVRSYLPNIVEIGGFHVAKTEPLPKDYQDLLDKSKNGVILFSMGSFIKTDRMPKKTRDIFLKSLSKLNETVLWKYESEIEDLPKNVIIRKWMPQTSILAHPNVKLFISHGGMLSTIETTIAGIPVVSIPIGYDQFHNAKMVEQAKTGVIMSLGDLSEEVFDTRLNEVLNNKMYTENAKRLQKLYNDRPMSSKDLINFYTEYVVRTGGAKHLAPPHLSLMSSMLVDVFAVLLIPPILLFAALVCVCRRICCSKKTTVSKKDGKNKLKRN